MRLGRVSLLGVSALLAAATTGASLVGGSMAAASPASSARPASARAASGGAVVGPVQDHSASRTGALAPTQELRLVLGLAVPHEAQEEQFLSAVQTKGSPQFHQFLTAAQWNARFAPSPANQQAVVNWAKGQGLTVTATYADRLLVDVEAPASTVEKVFKVSIGTYRLHGVDFFANQNPPTMPASLNGILDDVEGLNSLPAEATGGVPQATSRPAYVSGPVAAQGVHLTANGVSGSQQPKLTNGWYDPTDIYSSQAYDATALYAQGHCCNPSGSTTGTPAQTSIALITDGTVAGSDLTGWHNQYSYLAYNIQFVNVDGGASGTSDESTLDTEWAMAMSNSFGSYLDTAKEYNYDSPGGSADFTDAYNAALSGGLARTMSISYAWAEGYGISSSTMTTDHNIFNSLTGQGWSVLAASGDHGSTGDCSHLSVMYPASDPDVISVGGTQLQLDSNSQFLSETAWGPTGSCGTNNGGSTGGCSSYFGAPSWQSPLYPCGSGSRAVPDFAINSSPYTAQNYFYNGFLSGVAGTSIATPELAGFTAQAEAYQQADGYGAFGNYAASLWYGAQHSYYLHNPFYDVTSGCNYPSGGSGYCAVTGYDLVTGWGSVNMLQLAWMLNWYYFSDDGPPVVNFSGPSVNTWYNSNQQVSWTVSDTGGSGTPSGVAGFTQGWDGVPADPTSEPSPGSGNSFYSGPQFPNATSGWLDFNTSGEGCHTVNVMAWDNMGWSSGDQTYGPVCYDGTIPYGSISIDSGAPATNKTAATLQLSAGDSVSGDPITGMRFSSDGSTWTGWQGYSTSVPYTLSSTNGLQTVYVEYENAAGTVSPAEQSSIYYDTVNPTATAPTVQLAAQAMSGGKAYLKVSWTGSDSGSGIQKYLLSESVNGGAYTQVYAKATPSATLPVLPGRTYQFRVQAVDWAGNKSAQVAGAVKKLTLVQETGAGITYSSGWVATPVTQASGGSVKRSKVSGNTVTFKYTGSSVAIVTDYGLNHGAVSVVIDGGSASSVNTYNTAAKYQQVPFVRSNTNGAHTLVITNKGTGTKIDFDLDAFLVLS